MFATQLFRHWTYQVFAPGTLVRQKYESFKELLLRDQKALEYMAELEDISLSKRSVDFARIEHQARSLSREVEGMTKALVALNPLRYSSIRDYFAKVDFYIRLALLADEVQCAPPYVARIGDKSEEKVLGGKGANLSRIQRWTDYRVPEGIVITTRAFHYFMEANNLRQRLDNLLSRVDLGDSQGVGELCREMQRLILEAEVPASVVREVERSLELAKLDKVLLAFRSSAVGEDSVASFAGQYSSHLNVHPLEWVEVYKGILASKYAPNSVSYRIRNGLADSMVPMAVVGMAMVQPLASGIMYTNAVHHAPTEIYMIADYGAALADGREQGQHTSVSPAGEIVLGQDADLVLNREQVLEVARIGVGLEEFFGVPQDVEWAVNAAGQVIVLQSRPLPGLNQAEVAFSQDHSSLPDYPEGAVLCSAKPASPGQATGQVYIYQDRSEEVPKDCILIVEHMTPDLSVLVGVARAIIAVQGSPACHLASVAKEQRLPVVYEAKCARELRQGRMVSVDAQAGLVLDETVKFADQALDDQEPGELSPVQGKLKAALEHISPLNLTDPEAADFSPAGCRSMHDIIRFVHEAGVREMFNLVGGRGLNQPSVKRLVSEIPLVMHVLDVEEGLSAEAKRRKEISPKDIINGPMLWLWSGLTSKHVQWNPEVLHYDWSAYHESQVPLVNVEKSTMFSSYAVLGDEYLHTLFRFGFHFAVVDCMVGPAADQNYLHLRFKGGGGLDEQRLQRLEVVARLLDRLGFTVKTTGDLLEASIKRRGKEVLQKALRELGIVLGKTVQLDMRIHSKEQVLELVAQIEASLEAAEQEQLDRG